MKKVIIIASIVVVLISVLSLYFVGINGKLKDVNEEDDTLYYMDGWFTKYAVVIESKKSSTLEWQPVYINKDWDYREQYSNEEKLLMPCIYSKNDVDGDLKDIFAEYCLETDKVRIGLSPMETEKSSNSVEKTLIDGYYGTLFRTEPDVEFVFFPDADETKLSAEIIDASFDVHKVRIYKKSFFGKFSEVETFEIGFNTHWLNQRGIYKEDFKSTYE